MNFLKTKEIQKEKFDAKDLSVLAYANNFTIWHYRGDKAEYSTIMSAGFFDKAADMLRTGDMMILNAFDANDVVWVFNESGMISLRSGS